MSLNGVFILDCLRTPRARVKSGASALSNFHPQELLGQTLRALVNRSAIDATRIEDVIIGCVTEVEEQGANIARNAALTAGLPISVGGITLNRCCASGLQAINFAAAEVASTMADLVIAGGVESVSRVKMGSDGGGVDRRLQQRYFTRKIYAGAPGH